MGRRGRIFLPPAEISTNCNLKGKKMTRSRWLTKPEGLSPEAGKIWKFYAPGLYESERLTPETAENFRLLCETLAIARAAASEIAQNGVTIETKTGVRKSNPAVAVFNLAQRQAAKLLRDFGLT